MSVRSIPITVDRFVQAQQTLHGGALNALATAVDQADHLEAGLLRREQVLVDHRHDIARGEWMQVDRIFDGNVNGVVFHGLRAKR